MRLVPPFALGLPSRIVFGEGRFGDLASEIAALGRRVLLITGARSFRQTARWGDLLKALADLGLAVADAAVMGEPTTEQVDQIVADMRPFAADLVVGIGGGSVLDTAKAVAGLLPGGQSVMAYLEGVGEGRAYNGPAVPLITVPTTAGTGAEVSWNAVLSRPGPLGFKKSFRHPALAPRLALVDPDLIQGCPSEVLRGGLMDAATQLIEAFVSTRANPVTDAMAWAGLEALRDGFQAAAEGRAEGLNRLALAALLSGLCLSQTGLGAVHGIGAPLGAAFGIPHGLACGLLLAETTNANIEALLDRDPMGPGLAKYGRIGGLLAGHARVCGGDGLVLVNDILDHWTDQLAMPRLTAYGMTLGDIPAIVGQARGSSMRTNPVVLTDDEVAAILRARM